MNAKNTIEGNKTFTYTNTCWPLGTNILHVAQYVFVKVWVEVSNPQENVVALEYHL